VWDAQPSHKRTPPNPCNSWTRFLFLRNLGNDGLPMCGRKELLAGCCCVDATTASCGATCALDADKRMIARVHCQALYHSIHLFEVEPVVSPGLYDFFLFFRITRCGRCSCRDEQATATQLLGLDGARSGLELVRLFPIFSCAFARCTFHFNSAVASLRKARVQAHVLECTFPPHFATRASWVSSPHRVCRAGPANFALSVFDPAFESMCTRVCSKRVQKAFQICSRDIFVPDDQKEDAFLDHPVPLDHDFNISAPRVPLS
jgi:hypothetical protein